MPAYGMNVPAPGAHVDADGEVYSVEVGSKIKPEAPWQLYIKAEALEGAETRYRIHIEGFNMKAELY